MKVWEVLDLKEEAGGIGAGSFARHEKPQVKRAAH